MNMSISLGRAPDRARSSRARARPQVAVRQDVHQARLGGVPVKWLLALGAALLLALAWHPGPAQAAEVEGAAARAPVAKVTTFTGTVEVSTDGQRWRPLKRAKLLFNGYRVRTGANGTASVAGRGDDAFDLGPRTVVAVESRALRVVSGQATRPQRETGLTAFFSDLQRRFVSRQRYTTVRRGVDDAWQVLTPDHVTASADYPTLVWQNGGASVRYRLHVGSQAFDVPAAPAGVPYVTYQLRDVAPGTHTLLVEVLDADGTVKFADPNGGELVWLDAEASRQVKAQHAAMLADASNTDEEIAEFLSSKGLLVAAMTHCHDYLVDSPEDEAMTLAYLKALKELRLDALHAKTVANLAQVASAP